MKYLVLLIALSSTFIITAQDEGMIKYEQTVQLKIELDDDMAMVMKDLPTENKSEFALYRSGDEVIYKNLVDDGSDDLDYSHEGGDMQMNFKIQMPQNILYQNLSTQEIIEQKDFLGKKFLIEDKAEPQKWKMTGKSKMILEYACQEAILQDTGQNVVAWFAPTIPWQIGPQRHAGLPGLILELQIDDDRVIIAREVSFEPVSEVIEAPNKGKKVTMEEFEKIRDEKMKEMGATSKGGNSNVKMIIRRN